MTNHPNRKILALDDIKGCLVPVSRKFKKGCLFTLHPSVDKDYSVSFVVNWKEKIIYVNARHGNGTSMAEFRGEEWAAYIKSSVIPPYYEEDAPSHSERQEEALRIARAAQEFLRAAQEGLNDLPGNVNDTVKRALSPAEFVVGAKDELGHPNMNDYELHKATIQVQGEALKKIDMALAGASS